MLLGCISTWRISQYQYLVNIHASLGMHAGQRIHVCTRMGSVMILHNNDEQVASILLLAPICYLTYTYSYIYNARFPCNIQYVSKGLATCFYMHLASRISPSIYPQPQQFGPFSSPQLTGGAKKTDQPAQGQREQSLWSLVKPHPRLPNLLHSILGFFFGPTFYLHLSARQVVLHMCTASAPYLPKFLQHIPSTLQVRCYRQGQAVQAGVHV